MTKQKIRKDGKPVIYRSNGTGRDSYISQNNGGLLSKSLLHNLKNKHQSN